MLVAIDDGLLSAPSRDAHRDDFIAKSVLAHGARRTTLALVRERVLLLARDAEPLGDLFRRLPERDGPLGREPRIDEAPPHGRVRQRRCGAREALLRLEHHPGRARHALDAPGNEARSFV